MTVISLFYYYFRIMRVSQRIAVTTSLGSFMAGLFYLVYFHISDSFISGFATEGKPYSPMVFWMFATPSILVAATGLGALTGFIIYRIRSRHRP